MKHLKTEVLINAPAATVWAVLMDFDEYSNWNPFIQQISGPPKVGQILKVQIHPPNQNAMQFKPTVLQNEEEKAFRWKGKLFVKGLFDGEHYFTLESVSAKQTRLIHGERFSGLLSGLIMKRISEDTLAGFKAMNEALKRRAEANY